MPNRYVRMDILTNGADKAKKSLDELYLESERLDGKTIDMDARLKSTDFQATADELKRKADILNKYRIEMTAKIGGTDKADAQLMGIRANIDSIYHKLDEKHDISVGGLAKLNADLIKTKMLIDSLPNRKDIEIKTTDRVTETERKGFIDRARSVAGGRSSMSDLLPGGPRGGGGGGSAVSGLLSGGVGQGLASAGPYAIGGLAGLAAALLPSVTGLGVGGLAAGGGVGLAALFASQSATAIKQDQQALAAAKTASQKQSARNVLKSDMRADTPFIELTADVKNLETPLMAMVTPFTKALLPVINQFAGWLKSMGPALTQMFSASLPFVKAFVLALEQGGKQMIPAFTQAMNTMVKSGALKEMMSGIVDLMNGLTGLIRIMGPEMKTSAGVFVGLMKVIQGLFNTVGLAVDSLLSVFRYMGKTIQSVGKIFADVIHGDFGGAFRAVMDWVHNIEHLFGDMRHEVSVALDNMGFSKFGHMVADTFDKIRHDVATIWDATWHWVSSRVSSFFDADQHAMQDFRHSVARIFDTIRSDVKNIWDDLWKWVGQRFDTSVHFTENLLGDLRHNISTAFDNIRSSIHNIWDDTWSWVGNRLQTAKNFELRVIDDLRSGIAKGFQNIKHDVTSIWDDVWNDVHNIAANAITKLGSVLDRIKNAFNSPFAWVGQHVLEPLANAWNWIGSHTGHILPKMPTAFHLAQGGSPGRIMQGRGQGIDDVPAMIGRDETVVSASHSRMLAPIFAAAGVPGYAAGGIPNPLHLLKDVSGWGGDLGKFLGGVGHSALSALEHIPGIGALSSIMGEVAKGAVNAAGSAATHLINGALGTKPEMMTGAARATGDLLIGRLVNTMTSAVQSAGASNSGGVSGMKNPLRGVKGLVPERVDQGVDYSGTGPIYAIAPGVIVNTAVNDPGGWGSVFIKERLTGSPYSGKYVYTAEGVTPKVHVGQKVGVNDVIAEMHGGIETGWASPSGDLTLAQLAHQFSGSNATAYGENFNKMLIALGAPGGTGGAHPRGTVPKGFYSPHSGSVGNVGSGYINIGKALMRIGFSKGAASGITGDIANESGGHPDSIEGNEFHKGAVRNAGTPSGPNGGLIGWTTTWTGPGQMITGNVSRDMGAQIEGIRRYVERNGSMGDMNRFRDPVQAADHFSIQYERPLHRLSDVNAGVARSVFSHLDTGEGWLGQGLNLVYNGLGRREHLVDPDRYKNQSGGSGGDCYHITVNGAVDGDATAKQIVQLINQRARHNGGRTGLVKN